MCVLVHTGKRVGSLLHSEAIKSLEILFLIGVNLLVSLATLNGETFPAIVSINRHSKSLH